MSEGQTQGFGSRSLSRRRLLALTAGGSLATASFLTLRERTAAQGAATKGGSLRVTYAEEPVNLHPQINSGTEGWYVVKQIYDGLLNMDGTGKIVPGLATGMPDQPDPTTMIFHLRQNVKFHNGKPFTADDVIWTFDRLLGKYPNLQSTQKDRYQALIDHYEKRDDYTFQVKLKHPSPDFFNFLAAGKYFLVMPKDVELADPKQFGQSVAIGTGPFKLKEWVKGDHLTLVRNDAYWGEPAHVDQIVYKAIPEDATRMAALKAGETDVCLAPALKDVKDYEKDDQFTVLTHDGGNIKELVFNLTRPPFKDTKVRQAMAYAIDRQEIADAIYYGYATVSQDLVPPWSPYHDPARTYYPHDPDKAKQLLTEAGYGSGKSLEFEIVTTNATEFTDLSTLIQAQLQEIGVNAKISSLDKSAFYQKTYPLEVGKPNPNFQADIYRLIYGFATTDYTWRSFSAESVYQSGYNQTGGVQNPEAQQVLDQIAATSDPAKLKELVGKASDLINQDMPVLRIAYQKNVVVTRSAVKNLGITVLSIMPLKDVWLAQ